MAHARRKLFELHATNKSMLAEQALRYIQLLYEIESVVRDLEPDLRRRIRQEKGCKRRRIERDPISFQCLAKRTRGLLGDKGAKLVLLISHWLHPLDVFAIKHFGNREVRHRRGRSRTMPVPRSA